MTQARRLILIAFVVLEIAAAACGKRGNPQAPIRLVPAPVTNLAARRVGDRVELRFNVPFENADKSTPPMISRVEIYAAAGPVILSAPAPMSIAPFALAIPIGGVLAPVASTAIVLSRFPPIQLSQPAGLAPPPRGGKAKPPATGAGQILNKKYLRGRIEVRPAPEPASEESAEPPEGAQDPGAAPKPADDPRPQPGWITTFTEQVTAERAAAAQSPDASILRYVVVGVAGARRLGAPSPVVEVPLVMEVAPPPGEAAVTYDATTIKLTWTATSTAQVFRVYRTDAEGNEDGPPLNPAVLTTPSFSVPVEFGQERCFVVRAVITRGPATVESDPVGPACVTPVDTFPPPVPAGLSGLPTESQIQLLWSPVTAPDLAGYLVLRGADGSPLQPLMTGPITATSYTDANVRPGVHYTYAVVAVDKAGNRSLPSNQIEEIR